VYQYVEHQLSHNLTGVANNKVTYGLQSFFPVPIFGWPYNSQTKELGRALWSLLILAEYILAFVTAKRWWKSGRRADVVSVLLYPVFIVIFELNFDPQFRFILPVNLLLLPLAVEGVGHMVAELRTHGRGAAAGPSGGAGEVQTSDLLGSRT
jgi:hypothetical protein